MIMQWLEKQSESKGFDQWKKMSEAIDNAKKKEQLVTLGESAYDERLLVSSATAKVQTRCILALG